MWTISKHFLETEDGIRAVLRALKNALDYGGDTLLPGLREALDVYPEKVLNERETTESERYQAYEAQTELQSAQRSRMGREVPIEQQEYQSQSHHQVGKFAYAKERRADGSQEVPKVDRRQRRK